MRDHYSPSPSVVVGIDGSRSAVNAALWAVDEAVGRDIPLRLIYAIDPADAPAPIQRTQPATSPRPKSQSGMRSRRSSRRTNPSRSRSRSCKRDQRRRCSRPRDGPPWSASARWDSNTALTAGLARPPRLWRRPPVALSPSSADTIHFRRNNSGWSPSLTSHLPARACCAARLKRHTSAVLLCA